MVSLVVKPVASELVPAAPDKVVAVVIAAEGVA